MRFPALVAALLFLQAVPVRGAFEAKPIEAGRLLQGGALAAFGNPALLGSSRQIESATFYARLYSLSELPLLGSALEVPMKRGALGAGISRFGNDAYRETETRFGLSWNFRETFQIGSALSVYRLEIEKFGSALSLTGDFGARVRASRSLWLDLWARNPARSSIGQAREPLPQGWAFSADWSAARRVRLQGGVETARTTPFRFRTGLEWKAGDNLVLRAGGIPQERKFSAGFGVRAGNCGLDYALIHHAWLADTHQISVSVRFGRSSEGMVNSVEEKISLKAVREDDLRKIPGIGRETARKILQSRDAGELRRPEDLLQVPGLRRAQLFLLKERLIFEDDPPLPGGERSAGRPQEDLPQPK